MLETAAGLVTGEVILFDLPVAGSTEARVIWKRKNKFGCEFLVPVSKAAVSAALLLTPFAPPDQAMTPRIEELSVGTNLSVAELEAWKSQFEKARGARGYLLMGFRLTSDGLIIAIVARTN